MTNSSTVEGEHTIQGHYDEVWRLNRKAEGCNTTYICMYVCR
jgi:hypothetical protein